MLTVCVMTLLLALSFALVTYLTVVQVQPRPRACHRSMLP